MVKGKRKQVFIALIIILILSMVSLCTIYYVNKYFIDEEKNMNQDALNVSFHNKDSIYLKNILPLSDKLGKNLDVLDDVQDGVFCMLEFDIDNLVDEQIRYEVYLTKKTVSGNEILGKYVKIYLMSNDKVVEGFESNQIPNLSGFPVLESKPDSVLLYGGKLDSFEKKNMKLKIWISDTYAVSNILEEFKASVGVRVA